MLAIIGILGWLAYSLLGEIQFTSSIRQENREIAEKKGKLDELRAINPEIIAWITIEDTNIDFPIVQSTDNLKYINTTAYVERGVHGAIFLDYRNNPLFKDTLSVVYGHHMQDGNMFGNIDKFKGESFFSKKRRCRLKTFEGTCNLRIIGYLEISSDSKVIYEPMQWNSSNYKECLEKIESNAINLNKRELKRIKKQDEDEPRLLALSTCTPREESKRSVLILAIELE